MGYGAERLKRFGESSVACYCDGAPRLAQEDDLRALSAEFNVDGPDGFVVPSEYAEVIITK